MLCKLSSKILAFISKNTDIPSEMKDVYQYGIEITLSSIFSFLNILLLSLLLSDFFAGLVYMIVFVFLRSFSGGYHAATYFRCNLAMIVTFFIAFVLYKTANLCEIPVFLYGSLALVSLIPVAVYAPVPNKHKPLTDTQKKRSYKLSLLTYFGLSLMGIILLTLEIPVGAMIIITVTVISVLILVEIFMQRRGYHEG